MTQSSNLVQLCNSLQNCSKLKSQLEFFDKIIFSLEEKSIAIEIDDCIWSIILQAAMRLMSKERDIYISKLAVNNKKISMDRYDDRIRDLSRKFRAILSLADACGKSRILAGLSHPLMLEHESIFRHIRKFIVYRSGIAFPVCLEYLKMLNDCLLCHKWVRENILDETISKLLEFVDSSALNFSKNVTKFGSELNELMKLVAWIILCPKKPSRFHLFFQASELVIDLLSSIELENSISIHVMNSMTHFVIYVLRDLKGIESQRIMKLLDFGLKNLSSRNIYNKHSSFLLILSSLEVLRIICIDRDHEFHSYIDKIYFFLLAEIRRGELIVSESTTISMAYSRPNFSKESFNTSHLFLNLCSSVIYLKFSHDILEKARDTANMKRPRMESVFDNLKDSLFDELLSMKSKKLHMQVFIGFLLNLSRQNGKKSGIDSIFDDIFDICIQFEGEIQSMAFIMMAVMICNIIETDSKKQKIYQILEYGINLLKANKCMSGVGYLLSKLTNTTYADDIFGALNLSLHSSSISPNIGHFFLVSSSFHQDGDWFRKNCNDWISGLLRNKDAFESFNLIELFQTQKNISLNGYYDICHSAESEEYRILRENIEITRRALNIRYRENFSDYICEIKPKRDSKIFVDIYNGNMDVLIDFIEKIEDFRSFDENQITFMDILCGNLSKDTEFTGSLTSRFIKFGVENVDNVVKTYKFLKNVNLILDYHVEKINPNSRNRSDISMNLEYLIEFLEVLWKISLNLSEESGTIKAGNIELQMKSKIIASFILFKFDADEVINHELIIRRRAQIECVNAICELSKILSEKNSILELLRDIILAYLFPLDSFGMYLAALMSPCMKLISLDNELVYDLILYCEGALNNTIFQMDPSTWNFCMNALSLKSESSHVEVIRGKLEKHFNNVRLSQNLTEPMAIAWIGIGQIHQKDSKFVLDFSYSYGIYSVLEAFLKSLRVLTKSSRKELLGAFHSIQNSDISTDTKVMAGLFAIIHFPKILTGHAVSSILLVSDEYSSKSLVNLLTGLVSYTRFTNLIDMLDEFLPNILYLRSIKNKEIENFPIEIYECQSWSAFLDRNRTRSFILEALHSEQYRAFSFLKGHLADKFYSYIDSNGSYLLASILPLQYKDNSTAKYHRLLKLLKSLKVDVDKLICSPQNIIKYLFRFAAASDLANTGTENTLKKPFDDINRIYVPNFSIAYDFDDALGNLWAIYGPKIIIKSIQNLLSVNGRDLASTFNLCFLCEGLSDFCLNIDRCNDDINKINLFQGMKLFLMHCNHLLESKPAIRLIISRIACIMNQAPIIQIAFELFLHYYDLIRNFPADLIVDIISPLIMSINESLKSVDERSLSFFQDICSYIIDRHSFNTNILLLYIAIDDKMLSLKAKKLVDTKLPVITTRQVLRRVSNLRPEMAQELIVSILKNVNAKFDQEDFECVMNWLKRRNHIESENTLKMLANIALRAGTFEESDDTLITKTLTYHSPKFGDSIYHEGSGFDKLLSIATELSFGANLRDAIEASNCLNAYLKSDEFKAVDGLLNFWIGIFKFKNQESSNISPVGINSCQDSVEELLNYGSFKKLASHILSFYSDSHPIQIFRRLFLQSDIFCEKALPVSILFLRSSANKSSDAQNSLRIIFNSFFRNCTEDHKDIANKILRSFAVWINSIDGPPKIKDEVCNPEIDFLGAAKCAKITNNPKMAIIYYEIWCDSNQKHGLPIRKLPELDFYKNSLLAAGGDNYLYAFPEPSTVESLVENSRKNSNFYQYFLLENYMGHYDSKDSHRWLSIAKDLRLPGLASVLMENSSVLDDYDPETIFSNAWRLSDWSVDLKAKSKSSIGFNEAVYRCMVTLENFGSSSHIDEHKRIIADFLKHSFSKNSLPQFREMNEFLILHEISETNGVIKGEMPLVSMLEKWRFRLDTIKDVQLFSDIEPLLMCRAKLLDIIKKSTSISDIYPSDHIFQFSELAYEHKDVQSILFCHKYAEKIVNFTSKELNFSKYLLNNVSAKVLRMMGYSDKAEDAIQSFESLNPSDRDYTESNLKRIIDSTKLIFGDVIRETNCNSGLELVHSLPNIYDYVDTPEKHLSMAHFSYNEYKKLTESTAVTQLRENLSHQLLHLKTIMKQCSSEEKISANRLKLEIQEDKKLLENFTREIQTFLLFSLEQYLIYFCKVGGLTESQSCGVVHRLCSLWLENSNNNDTNVLFGSYLSEIPSSVFLVVIWQLTSRLDDLTCNSSDIFQNILRKLLVKMAIEHPYHCLWQLMAVRGSSDNKQRNASPNNDDSYFERQNYVSSKILQEASKKCPKLAKIYKKANNLFLAYIELANFNLKKNRYTNLNCRIPLII